MEENKPIFKPVANPFQIRANYAATFNRVAGLALAPYNSFPLLISSSVGSTSANLSKGISSLTKILQQN